MLTLELINVDHIHIDTTVILQEYISILDIKILIIFLTW